MAAVLDEFDDQAIALAKRRRNSDNLHRGFTGGDGAGGASPTIR